MSETIPSPRLLYEADFWAFISPYPLSSPNVNTVGRGQKRKKKKIGLY